MNVSTVAKYHRFAGLHFDPVRDVTEFIRDCRNSGMNKSKIIGRWWISCITCRRKRISSSMNSGIRPRKLTAHRPAARTS